MDDTQLIEADLVVDDENVLIETEIDVDDIDVDKDAEENFKATLGLLKIDVNRLNETKLVDVRALDAAIQKKVNVAEYQVLCSLDDGDSEKVHFEALKKRYNATCVKKKHKEILREVEVQVSKPPSWTPKNLIEDIDAVEQATNAS
nr:hypothetical protein [Tanacetum cinerariifolium]